MQKQNQFQKRIAYMLIIAMLCSLLPSMALAEIGDGYGQCLHHTTHTEECGYFSDYECDYICDVCINETQSLINALPVMDEIIQMSQNEKADVQTALDKIDKAKLNLSDAGRDRLDFTKYDNACFVIYMPEGYFGVISTKTLDLQTNTQSSFPKFGFLNEQGEYAKILSTDLNTQSELLSIEAYGASYYFYLPVGTYTVEEIVDGNWVLSMDVNGQPVEDYTVRGTNGTVCIINLLNMSSSDKSWYNSSATTYTLTTEAQLRGLAELVNDDSINFAGKTIILGNNINLTQSWTPIGSDDYHPFKGTFDGNGKSISGMNVNGNYSYAGFFGYVEGPEETVKNLTISNAIVSNSGNGATGGIVGRLQEGSILKCNFNGSVSNTSNISDAYAGGIVGFNSANCEIDQCYNAGSVTGNSYCGGIAGYNWGEITNCYNTGSVKINNSVAGITISGGIAGYNKYGRNGVKYCYNNNGDEQISICGDGDSKNSYTYNSDTASMFKNGEVTCSLQDTQRGQIWGQTIGTDAYPVLTNDDSKRVYEITFSVNNDKTYSYINKGQKVTKPTSDPVKEECSFLGWYVGSTVYDFDKTVREDITLVAKFANLVYELTYNLYGGIATNPESYTIESNEITLNNPTKIGYTFTGWSGTDLNGDNNLIVSIPKGSKGNRTYEAHYSENGGYAVLFDTDGGNVISNKDDIKWTDKVLDNIIAPIKNGYAFTGWKCGTTDVTSNTTYAELAKTDTVTDITLYAQWQQLSASGDVTTGSGLVYTGQPQKLITTGSAIGGNVVYSRTENGDYSADIPEATDADTYTVWYKIIGNGGYASTTPQMLEVTIAKANATVTAKDKSAYVGDVVPDFSKPEIDKDYTISGLYGTDTLDGVTITLTCNADMSKADTYAIVPSVSGENKNYNVQLVNGKLTVSDKPNNTDPVTPPAPPSSDPSTTPSGYYYGGGYYEPEQEKDKTEETVWSNPFTDVSEADWYYNVVKYAHQNKLFAGVSATEFGPNMPMSRGMLVTVLYRLAGNPAVAGTMPFVDVASNAYYHNAILWAVQNNIISGVADDLFAPDANITREQIAIILYRFAQYCGYDTSVGEDTNILSYDDFGDINEYAISAIQYAVGSNVMKGRTENTLNAQDPATRAEVAAMLQRFIEGNQ